MNKPVVRWTFGPCQSKLALYCLQKSVFCFQKIYGDSFDYFIFNNSQHTVQIENVQTIQQKIYSHSLNFPRLGPAWKLFPPRWRYDSHEIFIDNDLILYKAHPVIDEFLAANDMIFCTEGLERRFGIFDPWIAEGIKLNTGLFGLPPCFDLKRQVEEISSFMNLPPFFNIRDEIFHGFTKMNLWPVSENLIHLGIDYMSRFDEQGCLSVIFTKHHNLKIISLKEISVCYRTLIYGSHGCHFVGINSAYNKHYLEHSKNLLM